MAATERFTLISPNGNSTRENLEESDFPGLRVAARTTTSSLSDYPEWSMDELRCQRRDAIITDGACS